MATTERSKTFNYAVGMFGTSIPINLLKTYAAVYYVDKMGVPTNQWGIVLILYTIIDMIDNPIYGYLLVAEKPKEDAAPAMPGGGGMGGMGGMY